VTELYRRIVIGPNGVTYAIEEVLTPETPPRLALVSMSAVKREYCRCISRGVNSSDMRHESRCPLSSPPWPGQVVDLSGLEFDDRPHHYSHADFVRTLNRQLAALFRQISLDWFRKHVGTA